MNNTISVSNRTYHYFDLPAYAGSRLSRLPFSLRILLENVLRHSHFIGGDTENPLENILNWQPQARLRVSVPFNPSRVLLQDLTGVPLLVDLAAMRSAIAYQGYDPLIISPKIPVDLVIDHSLQVDFNQPPDPMERNIALEYHRNLERYQFIRWAQDAFNNFHVVPPGKGIVHQVNLEYLASVVSNIEINGQNILIPDTVFGTDSHTTMINGLGVLGWGVGGIEAIAAMLKKPIQIVLPDIIGLTFYGALSAGVTPTDLTLTIVERLREEGVVGKFIECFGEGLCHISVPDRSMIANMTPETGATIIYFPVDKETLTYLRLTGRSPHHVELVEHYCKRQNLFLDNQTRIPDFSKVIEIDLSMIQSSLAGPSRPQDRVIPADLKRSFIETLHRSRKDRGGSLPTGELSDEVTVNIDGQNIKLENGSILIAAITSCTNTSNPMVMLAAGLLAKKAVDFGLKVNPAVKCSLMPGSQVVKAYLEKSGLLTPLAQLGFHLVGYGCGTCIGNSGPLEPTIEAALQTHPLVAVSILSGNRNFESRIHNLIKANYLASPPLVVAYALAGRIDIDLTTEPLGFDVQGNPVTLADIYPTDEEVESLLNEIHPVLFKSVYENIFTGSATWDAIYPGQPSDIFQWDPKSTYITEPPYFVDFAIQKPRFFDRTIEGLRILALLGDSITTDHISPAGSIPITSPAGEYLKSLGIAEEDFNTYGSRRGNDRVMQRATFSNNRLKNALAKEREGGYTTHFPSGVVMTIFEAAQKYKDEKVPLIIIAGKEYGTGSSRDWAAKGPLLLGVKAIIAESYERIHRANLIGMGILPLTFVPGESAASIGLTGVESMDILGFDQLKINGNCPVRINREDGTCFTFETILRIETNSELRSFLAGGILHEALISSATIKNDD
jgi:aconitate hydratase